MAGGLNPSPHPSRRCVVLLGMHRSATSAMASVLAARGVHLGDRLLGASTGNPHGHFEDVDFLEFHRDALARRLPPLRADLATHPFTFDPSADELRAAHRILRARRPNARWGWKEPRTCLFATFWLRHLPRCAVALVYRHPLEVCDSLLRRGTDPALALGPDTAIHSWSAHNDPALQALHTHRGPTLVAHGGTALRSLPALHDALDALGPAAGLRAPSPSAMPDELRALPISPACHALFALAFPHAAKLYDHLQAAARIPAPSDPDPDLDPTWSAMADVIRPFPDAAPSLLPLILQLLGARPSPAHIAARLLDDFAKLESDLKRSHEIRARKEDKIQQLRAQLHRPT